MTWYAHQVFAEPSQEVISAFSAHAALRRGLYRIEHLKEFQTIKKELYGVLFTPQGSVPEYRVVTEGPKLPLGGLLVARELCAPNSGAREWFSPYDISWAGVREEGAPDPLLTRRIFSGDVDNLVVAEAPPEEFLRWLQSTARRTKTVISYFAKHTWGGDTEYAFGWVFNGRSDAATAFIEAREQGCAGLLLRHGQLLQREFIVDGDALTWTLLQHGLLLQRGYFELHTRSFPWERYRLNVSGVHKLPT